MALQIFIFPHCILRSFPLILAIILADAAAVDKRYIYIYRYGVDTNCKLLKFLHVPSPMQRGNRCVSLVARSATPIWAKMEKQGSMRS